MEASVTITFFINLVRFNDLIGVVYTEVNDDIRKIGVVAKVIGVFNQLYIQNGVSYPLTYARLEVLSRIKIIDYKNIKNTRLEYFKASVELLEDEISINNN